MKKFLSIIFVLYILFYNINLFAVCKDKGFLTFGKYLLNINWHCLFPVRLAGIKIDPFKEKTQVNREETTHALKENFEQYRSEAGKPVSTKDRTDRKIFCMCKNTGGLSNYLVGIRVGFWEPARVMEVVKDAWCFPFLGAALRKGLKSQTNDIQKKKLLEKIKKNGSAGIAEDSSYVKGFWQVHYYVFPVLAILDVLTDFICLENKPFDLAYVSEVDPRWNDGLLNAMLHPESLLFANPIALLGCIPDVVAATVKGTIDPLYWCMGQWGTVYPLTGYVNSDSNIRNAISAMGKTIFLLHRSFVLFGSVGDRGLCKMYPMPIWKKSQYKWHLLGPKKDSKCRVIGEPTFLWEQDKNPPIPSKNIDNFIFILWRKRTCCAR